MDCSTPGFPVPSPTPGACSNYVHRVGDAIQPCHPLLSSLLLPLIFPSTRVFSNESVFCYQVAKVLEFQLQHQSFQWILEYIHWIYSIREEDSKPVFLPYMAACQIHFGTTWKREGSSSSGNCGQTFVHHFGGSCGLVGLYYRTQHG